MSTNRKAQIFVQDVLCGILEEVQKGKKYKFTYLENYNGPPVSLTMPVTDKEFTFESFPAFFDGVLPEGMMLEGLLKQAKLDRNDFFGQLIVVGNELVGAVTVKGESL
jgi:serine/threonine-protein kinase HipA